MRDVQIRTYLQRLAYTGPVRPDLETLRGLHLAHLRRVAFENLSIHAGQAIVLDEALLYRKIVEQGRGGICYELNGLFAHLLQALGFRVSRLAAQVAGADGRFGPEFDHMALLVHLDEDYLADVGFGDCFELPLRLEEPGWQDQGRKSHRLSHADGYDTLYQQQDRPQGGAAQYRFKGTAHGLQAFAPMCGYHQSSPASHFTQKRICSLAMPEGRVSLSDLHLIVTRQGERVESLLESQQAFAEALREHFGIVL